MKRIVVLFILICACSSLAWSQEIISISGKTSHPLYAAPVHQAGQYPLYENMRYKDYSHLYDARKYYPQYDDPYDPFLAGVASYFIPGLGQTVCGEAGRGLGFLLGTGTLTALTLVSAVDMGYGVEYYDDNQTITYTPSSDQVVRTLSLLAGTCAVYIWNIIDARKVAKIKNMYYHDVYGSYVVPQIQDGTYPARAVNPYMRYRDYKDMYSTRGYRTQWGDPYDPFVSGLASAVFPGLGQCVAGEWGRGALFGGGYMLLMATMAQGIDTDNVDDSGMWFPLAAMAGLYVWNICDAVKVAKIKNLYTRDLRGQMAVPELSLEPYINNVPAKTGSQLVGGLALRVNL